MYQCFDQLFLLTRKLQFLLASVMQFYTDQALLIKILVSAKSKDDFKGGSFVYKTVQLSSRPYAVVLKIYYNYYSMLKYSMRREKKENYRMFNHQQASHIQFYIRGKSRGR